jgi:hypothetical protein
LNAAEAPGAADFARRFAEFWAAPAPDLLDRLLAEEVRLVAPLTPTTHTLDQGRRAFEALLSQIAEMRAVVHDWGATEDGVLIDFTVSGRAGGSPISWRAVDRFVLGDDGLATERVSYFDSLPLVLTLARRPRARPSFLGARLRR